MSNPTLLILDEADAIDKTIERLAVDFQIPIRMLRGEITYSPGAEAELTDYYAYIRKLQEPYILAIEKACDRVKVIINISRLRASRRVKSARYRHLMKRLK